MAKAQSYKDLEVYQLSHELAIEIHHLTLRLPRYEQYEIGSQLRRSSKSISANIVEGFSRRRYKAEFVRFLIFSHGSCNESIEWLEYIRDCYKNFEPDVKGVLERMDTLGRKINRFITVVSKSHNPDPKSHIP